MPAASRALQTPWRIPFKCLWSLLFLMLVDVGQHCTQMIVLEAGIKQLRMGCHPSLCGFQNVWTACNQQVALPLNNTRKRLHLESTNFETWKFCRFLYQSAPCSWGRRQWPNKPSLIFSGKNKGLHGFVTLLINKIVAYYTIPLLDVDLFTAAI